MVATVYFVCLVLEGLNNNDYLDYYSFSRTLLSKGYSPISVTVPMANVGDYRNATGWNRFTNYIGKHDLTMRAERYYRADEDFTANDAKIHQG